MWLGLPVVLLFGSTFAGYSRKDNLTIGGLFESESIFLRRSFVYATEWVNENDLLSQYKLKPIVEEVDPYDNYQVSKTVCDMMRSSVAGIFGPRSVETSDHVQSICDALEIPHIEMRWDSRQRRGSCLVNLYPHPSTLSKVFVDLVRVLEWKSFSLLYEDNDGLIRLNGLLTYYDHKGFPVTVRQLDDGGNYRPVLSRIKNSKQKNIVLDCSADALPTVLTHAQQVGLIGPDYHFIITSMDFHTIDLEPFMYAQTNFTGIRLYDPKSSEVQNVTKFWMRKEKARGVKMSSRQPIQTEAALTHDAVLLYAKAMEQLLKSQEVEPKPLDCETQDNWEHGYSLINFMKMTETNGLTGLIKFDNEGFRREFKLEIIELTEDGILKKGTWNTTVGVNLTSVYDVKVDTKANLDLSNVTFVVMISLLDPHCMLKETASKLTGNDKYEGMGIDVIHELSIMNGFNYTIIEEEEGAGSGNVDNETGEWTGMIGKVMSGEADLAIADITITQIRQKDVDFTLPYMDLGISILYKKPKKAPKLFSFMTPFSDGLWKSLIAAYVTVSLLFYVLARISPNEWCNPYYPCVEDSELPGFENQFTIVNAFWFTSGPLLQQGSGVSPIALSTKLLASSWCIFTLIVVSSYKANLASSLMVESNVEPFRDVKELANQDPNSPDFVKYGAKAGGATEEFFKSSNDSIYRTMWDYMNENYEEVMVQSNKEGVKRVLSDSEQYAFLMESASIDYEVQRKCKLRQVGSLLDNKGYGIVMRKHMWYRNILSTSVLKLQEKGKLTQLYKKWWKERRGGGTCFKKKKKGQRDEAVVPLDLNNVGGVFLVLVVGSALGCLLTLGELMMEVYFRENRGSFWQEFIKEFNFAITSTGSKRPKTH